MIVEVPDYTNPKGRAALGDLRLRMARQEQRLATAQEAAKALELMGDRFTTASSIEVVVLPVAHLKDWPGVDVLMPYLKAAGRDAAQGILLRARMIAEDYVKTGQYEECRACQRVVPSPCHTRLQPSPTTRPTAAFHRVMLDETVRGVGSTWHGYYGQHDERPANARDYWTDAPRPWKVDGGDVLAADGTPLFSKPFNMSEPGWARLAGHIVWVRNECLDVIVPEADALSGHVTPGITADEDEVPCEWCGAALGPDHACMEPERVLELTEEMKVEQVSRDAVVEEDSGDIPF